MTTFYKVVRAIVTPFAYLFFNIKKYGLHNIPEEGSAVLCCNHTSMSDVWLLIVLCPRQIFFMGKDELFKIPVIGKIFKGMGAFPVNRKSADKGAVNNSLSIVSRGDILGIFPEGTRHYNVPPQKAKPGAAMIALDAKAPIIPVSIYREGKVRFTQKATIRFGSPIPYSDYAQAEEEKISKKSIRFVSEMIMGEITKLWELKH